MSSRSISPEDEERLFEIFKIAVQDERKAQRLYAVALGLCTDPSLRPVLQGLIHDELRHEQILIERYNAMVARDPARLHRYGASDSARE
jgi:rubrerythrin